MSANSELVFQAVKTIINGIDFSAYGSPGTIAGRKRIIAAAEDVFPVILIAQGDGEQFEAIAKGVWLVRYPVSVAVVFKNAGATSDNPNLRGYMDLIWPTLENWAVSFVPVLPIINDVTPVGRMMFLEDALKKGFDWASKNFTVETKEARY